MAPSSTACIRIALETAALPRYSIHVAPAPLSRRHKNHQPQPGVALRGRQSTVAITTKPELTCTGAAGEGRHPYEKIGSEEESGAIIAIFSTSPSYEPPLAPDLSPDPPEAYWFRESG